MTSNAAEATSSSKQKIPTGGRDKTELLHEMAHMGGNDANWKEGRTWSLVYYVSEEHTRFLKDAHSLYFSENAVNPMAFQSLKRLESEVVQMTCGMLKAPAEGVGTMTSGGTESILLAVKTYRERARKKQPWIRNPEMVVPSTIHPAFHKAAHLFGLKVRIAQVGKDQRVTAAAMKKKVNRNTVMVAASAPQYAHGVIDPIADIGAMAQKRNIPLHVDGCFGGFMLPWIEKLGYDVPLWDFRVPGVTSISADLHKYGYAAKGASVITYRSMDYLKHQFFVEIDFPGGIYISPSLPGTRAGGPIAAAWASLMAMGEDGYLEKAKEAMEVADTLKKGIGEIDGIEVVGKPSATVVAYQSYDKSVDLYAVADILTEKKWGVDRQQNPASIHCTCNANNAAIVEEYLADLKEAVHHVKAHPELRTQGEAAIYGLMSKVPLRGVVESTVRKVMESMYSASGESVDLGDLEGSSDDPVMEFMGKYGDVALNALDKMHDAKDKIGSFLGR
ncbi:MAG: aspartate aminotransferase family protein [Deltaproteobacteria bacterium]|nr:aspartate aminotransferase family protein [Deltaproteobacteria bacterium]